MTPQERYRAIDELTDRILSKIPTTVRLNRDEWSSVRNAVHTELWQNSKVYPNHVKND